MPSNTANQLDPEIIMTVRYIAIRLVILLSLLLAFTAPNTFASSWTEVSGGKDGGQHAEYNPSSIFPLPNGAQITWRTWHQSPTNNRGDFFELYISELNCKEFYLRDVRQSDIFWSSELKIIAEEERKAKENEESQGALRSYLSCAKTAIAVVDDLSSSADIVTIAAHSKCVDVFNHATKGLSSNATTIIEKQLRPKLIEFVFDWRRQIRLSPKQPKSPEKAPDNYKRIM